MKEYIEEQKKQQQQEREFKRYIEERPLRELLERQLEQALQNQAKTIKTPLPPWNPDHPASKLSIDEQFDRIFGTNFAKKV